MGIALHVTYSVVSHVHFVLSLGIVIDIFSGIMFFQDQLLPSQGSQRSISTSTSSSSIYHLGVTCVGIFLIFTHAFHRIQCYGKTTSKEWIKENCMIVKICYQHCKNS